MAALAMETHSDCLASACFWARGGEHRAAAGEWGERDDRIDRRVEPARSQRADNQSALEVEIGGLGEVLQRAAAALAIVRAARTHAIRAWSDDVDKPPTIACDHSGHTLAV